MRKTKKNPVKALIAQQKRHKKMRKILDTLYFHERCMNKLTDKNGVAYKIHQECIDKLLDFKI